MLPGRFRSNPIGDIKIRMTLPVPQRKTILSNSPCISQHGQRIPDRRRILLHIKYQQCVSPPIPSSRAVRFLKTLGSSAGR